jgi:hypothetical protein
MVGACVSDDVLFFFLQQSDEDISRPAKRHRKDNSMTMLTLHAGHFNFRSVFVFVCFLLYIPPIAGASGVGGGLILPGCENMRDLLALMDGSSTQRRSLRSRRPRDTYNGTGHSSCIDLVRSCILPVLCVSWRCVVIFDVTLLVFLSCVPQRS